MRDVTMESVQSFLELSLHVPLVVVFTSPRSEGSLALAKTLESQILSRGGAIGLGFVDADSSPEIAQAFQVQAVPTTLAVLGGNPVPLFQGTLDDADVAKALDSVLQAAEQLSVHGRLDGDEDGSLPEPELPPHVKEANEALSAGDFDKAHAAYSKALKENPGDEVAKVELARVELLQRVQGYDVQSIMSTAKDADLTDVDLHLQASDIEVAASRPESAFGRLLAVIRATSGDDREKARERIVALFNIVGVHDPLVTEVRKQLASALM